MVERPSGRAKLKKAFSKPSTSRRFIWANCEFDNGVLYAIPMEFQGNGMLAGMLSANALLDIPAESDCMQIGAEVDLRLLVE